MSWYLEVLKKYAVFSGRARRTEYWMFVLFNFIFCIVASVLDSVLFRGVGVLYGLYALAVLIPSLAVSVRRLHDVGKSGWFLLVGLIPIAGFIWLLILMCLDSVPGSNEYGPYPKA